MPIITEGFEMTSSGELPRPKLTLPAMKAINSRAEDDTSNTVWQDLKRGILLLNNLIGAKVTRTRTFAKYLDADNEAEGAGTEADPNAQFPKEVYYIDSKILEDKDNLQFELTTFTDMENFKLPGRIVLASRCPWAYRGEGCCYEFKALSSTELAEQKKTHGATEHLPDFAPPIATYNNKKISEEISNYNPESIQLRTTCTNTDLTCPSEYDKTQQYPKGKVVYLKKHGLKYYFVSRGGDPDNSAIPVDHYTPPPNEKYWATDQCSKTLNSCKFRWGTNGAAKDGNSPGSATYSNQFLNFGGFPGTNTRITI
jgi:lambda family phage minor tail protein L